MGIKLTGIHLGYMGMDKELLAFPNPELVLHADKQQGQKQWYRCPSLGFIIDHPDGKILWNTGLSTNWEEEWLAPWKWLLDQKKPTLMYGDQELMKGVHLLHLPGHTPGTTGVLLELGRTGWVLLTDDALYLHESLGPPPVMTPITTDFAQWGTSVEKIRQV